MSILAEEPERREEEDVDSCTSEEAREDRLDEFVPLNEGIMESGLILCQLDGAPTPIIRWKQVTTACIDHL